jgi:5-carboxymethyl-2-hydroxymuconate isomerase
MRVAGQPGSALVTVDGDRIVPLVAALAGIRTLDEFIAAGSDAWAQARELAGRAGREDLQLDPDALVAPLLRPSKIVCIGLNYHDHAAEQGVYLPEVPLVFAKFPSTLNAPHGVVSWPPDVTANVDWEVELGVIVGRRIHDVSAPDALAAVFGYTAANDISARDIQFADGQWVRGKSLDGFLPLGPVVVTADEFGDPRDHRLRAWVNGELVQDSNTSQLIFGVGEVLSYLSKSFTLMPGDLILTGTPAGVGAFREPPMWLQPGDVVEVEIDGIGRLVNRMVAHSQSASEEITAAGAGA